MIEALSVFIVLGAILIGGASRRSDVAVPTDGGHAADKPDPSAGIRIEADGEVVSGGRMYDRLGRFLYEAARSGRFGVVETTNRYQWAWPGGKEWRVHQVQYQYVDDLDRCASLPAAPMSLPGFPRTDLPKQIIQNHLFLDDLASGRCVVATEIDRPVARYVLKPDGTLVDGQTGGVVASPGIPRGASDNVERNLWNAFGLTRVNATRFDDDGNNERLDNVPDATLVRTLTRGSITLKQAAAGIIARRLQVSTRHGLGPSMIGYGSKLHETKPNGTELGRALIDSGLIQSTDLALRADGLRAAAAIPSAREQLMPTVMQAMTDMIVPPPLDYQERLLSGRLDAVLPFTVNGLFRDTTPRPGGKFDILVDTAALAAARFGPEYAELFVTRWKPDIVSAIRSSTSVPGIALAAASAPSGFQIVDEGLRAFDANGAPITLRNVAAILAAYHGPPSTEVMAVVRSRCDTAEKNPYRRFSSFFCDAMTARTGDQQALDRLSRVVIESKPKMAGELDGPSEQAADALLLDSGPAGVERLRLLAANAEPAAANVALGALCNLGPDAGPTAIARARALAKATTDAGIHFRNARCSATKPTTTGYFAEDQ